VAEIFIFLGLNLMTTLNLFPTQLYKSTIDVEYNREAVLTRTEEYLAQYPEYKQGNLENGARGIHDSVSNLHKDPVYKPIVDFINRAVDDYWKILNYSSAWKPGICHLWANQYPKGGYASIHNHSPVWLTGVFYLKMESGMGDIYFVDPNISLVEMQPISDERRYQNKYQSVEVRSGDLVIFPAWLNHGTYPNTTDEMRIVLPFEISFKGADLYHKISNTL